MATKYKRSGPLYISIRYMSSDPQKPMTIELQPEESEITVGDFVF